MRFSPLWTESQIGQELTNYGHACSFQTFKWKSSVINRAGFSCLYTEKATCFILFPVLTIGLLHRSASPLSVFNAALPWSSAAAEGCEILPSQLPELHTSEQLSELDFSARWRDWLQIGTITAAWTMLPQKTCPHSLQIRCSITSQGQLTTSF